MKTSRLLRSYIAFCLAFLPALAHALSAADEKASAEVVKILTNPAERAEVTKDGKAHEVDQSVTNMLGGDQKQIDAMYSVAAQIFSDLVAKTDGDTSKIEEILQRAQKDPEGFYNSLSADAKKSIHSISGHISEKSIPSTKPTIIKTSP